uniref:Enoyl reductase (ER) domain-containing protein n=1 Tax=Noctiluca scintillans TaxID=2966 RepID=A0A7S1AM26_NOCSC|mmetsp:Transcript_51927/g.138434  ORF Transcript_51927/g.138434 Transcript_51927/m.138434 type:complete len:358 (+) Transcript_51927:60-1133(+)
MVMRMLSMSAVLGSSFFSAIAQATLPTTMRAVVTAGPAAEGDFSNVKLVTDQPVPVPAWGQALIKVSASSVNPVDYKLLTMLDGPKVLGFDVAGTVVKAETGCWRLNIGDRVWADLGMSTPSPVQLGAWAEYALADCDQISEMPTNLDFPSAAVLPLVSLTDYQAYKKAGSPWLFTPNLTVVVTSGSGGTGISAIQMAKAYSATRIITASSPENFDLLKGLGATDVVDYHTSTIWDLLPENSVDVVYDNYGAPGTADAAMPSLRSGGAYIFLPGHDGNLSSNPKEGVTQINFGLCDASNYEDLDALASFANQGKLKPVIGQTFALENIVQALNASFTGQAVGKVSITISQESEVALV